MTKRKSKNKFIFMSILLLVGILLSVSKFTIPFTYYNYNGFINAIPLGFDLQGGVSVVFEASLTDDNPTGNLDLSIKGTISRIELLLEDKGYNEHYVYKQGTNKIMVEVPLLTDTKDLFDKLNQPSSFKITKEENVNAEAILTGKHIENAGYSSQTKDGVLQHGVAIVFNETGKELFANLTSEIAQSSGTIYIYVGEDTTPLTRLTSSGAITNGTVFISSSSMTEDSANEMALKILSGSFESKLNMLENNVISASLGINTMHYSTIAVTVVFFVSLLIMIFFFKDFGLLSAFSSMFWVILYLFFLQSVPFVRLSLSSFAGIIISIIINMLAYLIIFKNIKEENDLGKKLHMSIKNGFKNSIGVIVDYHVVALLASIILMLIGNTAIKGFAMTLLIGSAISLFTSLVQFRWFLKLYLPLNSTNVHRFKFEKVEVRPDDFK